MDRYKEALTRIARELIYIDKDDLKTAEQNILRHLHSVGVVVKSSTTESGYQVAKEVPRPSVPITEQERKLINQE